MWVRSEYAGELAVLLTWLSALLPWNVTYSSGIGRGALLFVRFPLVQIRYSFGVPLARGTRISDPLSATAFQRGQSLELVYQVWTVGAAIFAVALVVSILYYRKEAWAESWPVDPVRILGGLLFGTGAAFAGATYLLLSRGFPGLPIPIGVVFLLLFGGLLLTVDRTE
ncbi:DUF7549 family protein [Haloplanus aerogenes]|uniref:Uncharacterized protein (TIGR04206 family) n=1 Tax=Haloplanus aerogenes TaxID=660522 RepID=A0A3M0DT59_9EURY|nr:hypothetical protein [Haloplanus aerogenes]AZH25584.1 hypothetical protein DU502_09400 [Haloplanus aerogenes]RMB25304.1 uncharacterized protein (TIGR04206 family) [Haloplanus aerogenes]